jgi:PAS domain S-box-containing protein
MANLANTFTPESFDTFRQELICLWNGGNEMASDAIVKTLAGDVRNVTVYFSVCPGSEDTLSKILVSLVDITARKKAENALIKSETGLKEAQRIGRLGSWELDITNNILTWSDEIYRMFEIDPSEFGASYEAFINAIHPDDREKVDFAYVNSLKTHAPYAIDHRLCFADGRVKYVQEQCETFYDGDSKPLRSVGIVQDITERKLAEEAIRISEAKYRIVADNTYDWEFWLDPEGQFLYTSPSCEGITGYKPFDFSADSDLIFRLVHPEDRYRFETHERASLGEHPEPEQEFRIIRANGEQRWIGHVCGPVYDERGKFLGLRGSNRDITERKLAEEEIRKLNQELEKRVVERTSQLELANKELEAFSYSVSHDLRAPLRGIDGFSQVLHDDYCDKIDEKGRNYLQRIRLASQRMSQLIDDMLNLSRISRSEMNIRRVNLSSLAQDIINELRESQPERNVEFLIQEGITVLGDERLLRIVLENLLGNAWKFTSKHQKARIEFGLQKMEDKPVYFIRDDGAGFDMSYAQKLFGAFQRLHTTEEFSGTGIGLATVQRIIRRHGGKVWAEGEIEKGTTIYFTIP